MADEAVIDAVETDSGEGGLRIYETGYLIVPSVKEEDLEKTVSTVRTEIEKAGGSFIAEGAPSMTRLAYAMAARTGDRTEEYDRAYFGWIKFEARVEVAEALDAALKVNTNILRSILFRTVREDTRAKYKAPTLREVKRTDTIKSSPRRVEEPSVAVSEEELDKALLGITTE
jgi:ribosomal protein S6